MQLENTVELTNFTGGDLAHANAAWVSTSQELTEDKKHRVPILLSMLAENKHGTPFEHSLLSFKIRSELATHIQFLKHRSGVSINSESARYKELLNDSYYIPGDWPEEVKSSAKKSLLNSISEYHKTLDQLTPVLGRKRAKETSRFLLPYGHQLSYCATFNFRSFMHFQSLRNADDSQDEVANIADQMLGLVSDTNQFEHSLKAFGF